MSLKKFLAKHSGELAKVTTVLGAVVHALPIDRQDKTSLGKIIGELGNAANSIGKSAEEMSAVDVTLDKTAIKAAIEEMLPDLLGAIAEKVFEVSAKREREAANPPPPAPPKAKPANPRKRAAQKAGPK